ncbi:MAG: hypothetical protein WC476_11610 [Phycisphaerae bacterium]|jgi:prepilin-type processing-associated H-X9-DG protein
MIKHTGLTRIDLVVAVVCVVFVLANVPVIVAGGRQRAKLEVCMTNLRTLTSAWSMYADDNDGKIPGSDIGYQTNVNPRSTWWIDWPDQFSGTPSYSVFSYVGLNWPVAGYSVDQLVDHAKQAIKDGRLWPYIEDLKSYKCPTSRPGDYQSYTMVDSMNGWCGWPDSATTGKKKITNKIQIQNPAERIVLLCECPQGFGNGKGSWGVYYTRESFGDAPPKHHDEGTTFSFADGHSEYWKWEDQRTLDGPPSGNWLGWESPGNEDLQRLQIGIWGELGYTP